MITGAQIRAARGLLDWTRDELAKRCGITGPAVKNIENNPAVKPHQKTLEALRDIFAANGVEFTERGVRWIDDMVKVLEGEDAYLRMLDDVYYATHKTGGEVLWFCSSDRCTLPGEYEAEVRIRDAGVRFRSLVEEGQSTPTWPRKEYRQIPTQYFTHNLQVIYADKVAQILDGGRRVLILHNETFTTTARNVFNLIWSLMKALPKLDKPDGE